MSRTLIIGALLVLGIVGGASWYQLRQHAAADVGHGDAGSFEAANSQASTLRVSPAAAPVPRNGERPIAWSTVERSLIKGHAVDSNAQQAILLSDTRQFSKAMDALEAEMLGSSSARKLAEDYRELLIDRMQFDGRAGLSLGRFACSEQICIGQFFGSDAAWNMFDTTMSNTSSEDFPALTRSYYAHHDRTTGSVDYRMFFTTNPQINGFQIRHPRATGSGM